MFPRASFPQFQYQSLCLVPCDSDDVQDLACGQNQTWLHHRMDHLFRPFKISVSRRPLSTETPVEFIRLLPAEEFHGDHTIGLIYLFESNKHFIFFGLFVCLFVSHNTTILESWVAVFLGVWWEKCLTEEHV